MTPSDTIQTSPPPENKRGTSLTPFITSDIDGEQILVRLIVHSRPQDALLRPNRLQALFDVIDVDVLPPGFLAIPSGL